MRTLLAAALSGVVLLSACASQPPKVSDTRWPQAVIAADKDELRESIMAKFAANATIVDATDSLIQLRGPVSNPTLTRALLGCGSCADPYVRVNISLAEVTDGTQVVVQYWRMVPQYNGSEKRFEVTGSGHFNQVQESLWKLRDRKAIAES